jgi:hypothetical protein
MAAASTARRAKTLNMILSFKRCAPLRLTGVSLIGDDRR